MGLSFLVMFHSISSAFTENKPLKEVGSVSTAPSGVFKTLRILFQCENMTYVHMFLQQMSPNYLEYEAISEGIYLIALKLMGQKKNKNWMKV